MFLCAYELDIDITDVKQELLEHFNNRDKHKQISKYGDIFYHEVTNSFTERFDNCFLNKVRFSRIPAGQRYDWHLDNNAAGELLHQDEGVPSPTAIPCTVNILLSNPVGDVTYFGRPTKLQKFSITSPSWELEQEMTVIDTIETKKRPVLINTDTFHKISTSTSDRIVASFNVWPGISFNSFVDYCKSNGVLMER